MNFHSKEKAGELFIKKEEKQQKKKHSKFQITNIVLTYIPTQLLLELAEKRDSITEDTKKRGPSSEAVK